MGPPVRSAFKPESAHHYDVPSVPVYHPTEEEWAGDPLAYINKIRSEAEKFGVCNIVCPPSWRPEFRLPNKDELRFRTRIQAVNELQDRPAGPSKRARENAAKARAALEAAGIDPATFPPGFLLSGGGMGGGGGRMGGGGQKPTPPAPDTPPGSTGRTTTATTTTTTNAVRDRVAVEGGCHRRSSDRTRPELKRFS
jgi:histone demethylase JARID1